MRNEPTRRELFALLAAGAAGLLATARAGAEQRGAAGGSLPPAPRTLLFTVDRVLDRTELYRSARPAGLHELPERLFHRVTPFTHRVELDPARGSVAIYASDGQAPMRGQRAPSRAPGVETYALREGTIGGGQFTLRNDRSPGFAELFLSGSGVPVLAVLRGTCVAR